MRSGTLRERVTIQYATLAQDSYGEPIETWANLASVPTVWANVGSRAAGERFISGSEQLRAEISHTVRIRYRADVTVKMRLIWRTSRILHIENVIDPDGRKSDLILMCSEEQAGDEDGEAGPTYHLSFDGEDDTLLVAASASLNNLPSGNFTVEFAGAIAGNGELVNKKANDQNTGWDISYVTGTTIFFGVPFDSWAFEVSRYVLYAAGATVHHFAFVFVASPRAARVYIDGTEASYDAQTTDSSGAYDTDAGGAVYAYSDGFGGLGTGQLNWLRISDTARYTTNFTAPSLTVAPDNDGDTVLLLALDEGTGTTATDTSGNGNNGTISGATWTID